MGEFRYYFACSGLVLLFMVVFHPLTSTKPRWTPFDYLRVGLFAAVGLRPLPRLRIQPLDPADDLSGGLRRARARAHTYPQTARTAGPVDVTAEEAKISLEEPTPG
ncbi:hypothetical protein PG996_006902 [Apiospora saccharicola]|uniref:Uncharacterized protein n=1 Tax=Apiospora saccharicola TaxID=335842 RepID=A0ABR1VC20_9PEZI